MANVHVKLWRWTSNTRHDSATGVVVVDDAIENVLIIIRIDAVAMIGVEVTGLTIREMIVGMGASKAEWGEQGWEHIKDDEHRSVYQQI